MILTPVIPSVSNVLNFTLSGVGTCSGNSYWHTIKRLEIFGFACDKKEECNGKLMNIINTCNKRASPQYNIIILVILVTHK